MPVENLILNEENFERIMVYQMYYSNTVVAQKELEELLKRNPNEKVSEDEDGISSVFSYTVKDLVESKNTEIEGLLQRLTELEEYFVRYGFDIRSNITKHTKPFKRLK